MNEVYSVTPPTDPGWYWLKRDDVEQPVRRDEQGCWWRPEVALDNTDAELVQIGLLFGPRLPDSNETIGLRNGVKRYRDRFEWLFRRVSSELPIEMQERLFGIKHQSSHG